MLDLSLPLLVLLVLFVFTVLALTFRYIPNDRVGVVEKLWSCGGSLRTGLIAEQVETYTRQEKAAMKERELREAEARAKQQTFITESELSINIQSNQGEAEYERSRQEAARIQTLAARRSALGTRS